MVFQDYKPTNIGAVKYPVYLIAPPKALQRNFAFSIKSLVPNIHAPIGAPSHFNKTYCFRKTY